MYDNLADNVLSEFEMQRKVCPQLSSHGTITKCIGLQCAAFTITKTHGVEKIRLYIGNKPPEGSDPSVPLENQILSVFIANSEWNQVVEYNQRTYRLRPSSTKNVVDSHGVGDYEVISKLPSPLGYCFLNMPGSTIFKHEDS